MIDTIFLVYPSESDEWSGIFFLIIKELCRQTRVCKFITVFNWKGRSTNITMRFFLKMRDRFNDLLWHSGGAGAPPVVWWQEELKSQVLNEVKMNVLCEIARVRYVGSIVESNHLSRIVTCLTNTTELSGRRTPLQHTEQYLMPTTPAALLQAYFFPTWSSHRIF